MEKKQLKKIISKILSVMEQDLIPLTQDSVKLGNKIFGAAILAKSDLGLVIAGTNEETKNPLFHGEIDCLNKYWALPKLQRPEPQNCIFFSTHEPCSLCLSAITWSGFDNFYYFFSYEDSRDKFNIPHDLKILEQIFNCKDGCYKKNNSYWNSHYLKDLIAEFSEQEQQQWQAKLVKLEQFYKVSSESYQAKKGKQIPLS